MSVQGNDTITNLTSSSCLLSRFDIYSSFPPIKTFNPRLQLHTQSALGRLICPLLCFISGQDLNRGSRFYRLQLCFFCCFFREKISFRTQTDTCQSCGKHQSLKIGRKTSIFLFLCEKTRHHHQGNLMQNRNSIFFQIFFLLAFFFVFTGDPVTIVPAYF